MKSKQLPKIALGAWAWGNDGTFGGKLTDADLRPVFDAAMKAGLNLWDTAYAYGMGTSEKILGEFLRTVPRDSYLISDKFTPQCADPNAENAVVALYETSAKLLGTDYMDIYWIHNPVGAPEWTRKLIPLAKTGKIGRIGLSNHNLAEIREAAAILGAEGLKIAAIQNHYSLLNRSSETSGILDYCRENDITFFSYMVLEQGALSGKYDTRHPFPADSDRGAVYNHAAPVGETEYRSERDCRQARSSHCPASGGLGHCQGYAAHHRCDQKVYQVEDAAKAAALELSADEIETMERLASETPLNVIRYWEKEMK